MGSVKLTVRGRMRAVRAICGFQYLRFAPRHLEKGERLLLS